MSIKYWQLIGVVGIAISIASCNQQQMAGNSSKNPVQSATPLAAPKEVWMTEFQQINGTPYLYAPIYVATEERINILKELKSASYDRQNYGSIDVRNYMFVHRDNLSASKLLANNSGRLLEIAQIGELAPANKSVQEPNRHNSIKKVQTLWYVKVAADTNGDKILDDRDRKQIAISDVSGANYTEIIQDIDKILLVYPKGIERRLVIYVSGNQRFVADIDLAKRQAIVKQLPGLN